MEKKSSTKDNGKDTEKLADTLLIEKKSLTNNVEKLTDELAHTLLMENKSSTKDVEKVTDELAWMKQKMNTIRKKILYQFECQSIRSKGWTKLDIEFLETNFLKFI